jgi:hypothetical protein
MYENKTYYGYGDYRRPDAYASGEIKWWTNLWW